MIGTHNRFMGETLTDLLFMSIKGNHGKTESWLTKL